MTTRVRASVIVLLSVLAVAGCTQVDQGQPSPAPSPTKTSTSIPNRPKDIDLASVDPCKLLTDAQKQVLKVYKSGPGPDETQTPAPSCSFLVKDPANFVLSLSPESKRGIDEWLNNTGNVKKRLISVDGFPAVQLINMGNDWNDPSGSFCTTNVSTAQGQELSMDLEPVEKKLSQAQMCDITLQAVKAALATLQTIK
ncbi:DUF3558 domain-containing protein [Kutzneria albida]|uniref:Secreted protein n=1 Tax=Kutzneria albida DSM 43870 TaxID=1449976 RepID=W5WUV0_9PSEU|nr:DUF3558 domain-containing protein [Kutzneria albida]AHI01940.1 hypothetical protein KALB_8583 [Kutzneria albida DSM 43870]